MKTTATVLVAVAVAALLAPLDAGATPVALRNVTVIDGTGSPPQPGRTVIVRGGTIADIVEAGAPLPAGASELDFTGHTLLPGLIDAHVHLTPVEDRAAVLTALLRSGVTTVRELAGNVRISAETGRRVAGGEFPSPAIHYAAVLFGPPFLEDPRARVSAGPLAPGQRFPGLVEPGDDIGEIIAERRASGATGVKLYASLDGVTLAALTDEAHRQGLKVWAHTVTFPGRPSEVVAAGVDAVIHSKGLIWEAYDAVPDSFAEGIGPGAAVLDFEDTDPEQSPFTELFAEMVRRGTILEPALIADGDLSPQPLSDHLRLQRDWACRATGAAYRAGVTLGAGSDTLGRADVMPRELARLVECGVPPLAAIRAATLNNAAAIGIEASHGSIQRGKAADLIIIEGDPLADIGATANVRLVMQAGRVIISDR